MRRTTIFLSILLTGLIAAFYSCSKDEAAQKEQPKSQISERHLQINRLINSFKDRMAYINENPGYKSGETVPADSALWYLEATINYSHGFPNEYYEEFQTDSLTLTIDKNSDGEVDLEELTQKYNEMKTDVATAYNASAFTEKGLTLVDLEPVSETNEELTISVKSITGAINPNPDTTRYNDIGDWEYGEDGGYCNSPDGEGDASEQFFAEILYLIANNQKANSFFEEIVEVEVKGGNQDFLVDENEPNNHLDYYLYYSIEGSTPPWNEDMLCIPNADMHAYNDYIYTLLFDFLPNEHLPAIYGQEKYFIVSCLYFQDEKDEDNINEIYKYFHQGTFEYGYDVEYAAGNNPTEIQ